MSNYKKYGLTLAEYEAMKQQSGNTCYICGAPPKTRSLCIDHDHKVAKKFGMRASVRGLTCFRCNRRVLGSLGDRTDCIQIWLSAIQYITKYRQSAPTFKIVETELISSKVKRLSKS